MTDSATRRPIWEGGMSKREYLAALDEWEQAQHSGSSEDVPNVDPAPDSDTADRTNADPVPATDAGTSDAPVGKP